MQETFPAEPNQHCSLGDPILQSILEMLSVYENFELRWRWHSTNIVAIRGSDTFLVAGVIHIAQGVCYLVTATSFRCSLGPKSITHKPYVMHILSWVSKNKGLVRAQKDCPPHPDQLLQAVRTYRPAVSGFRYYSP